MVYLPSLNFPHSQNKLSSYFLLPHPLSPLICVCSLDPSLTIVGPHHAASAQLRANRQNKTLIQSQEKKVADAPGDLGGVAHVCMYAYFWR
jgi:hypothetical protein